MTSLAAFASGDAVHVAEDAVPSIAISHRKHSMEVDQLVKADLTSSTTEPQVARCIVYHNGFCATFARLYSYLHRIWS